MVKPEVIDEKPINLYILKKELDSAKKGTEELNFRAQRTDEYLQQFAEITPKKAEELYEKIVKLKIPRIKDSHIHKVIDVLPKTVDELKVVLQGYTLTINNDNMKKIVSAVADAVSK